MIRWRWPVQIILLVAFLALTMLAIIADASPVSATFWIQLSPLVATVSAIAARTLWPALAWALILIVSTLLVGRYFCGWACPLGTLLDLTDRYIWNRRHSPLNDEIRPRAVWKHYILILVIVAAIFGAGTGLILDPLVLFTRTVELIVVPALAWLGYGSVVAGRLLPGNASFSVPWLESPPLYTSMTVTALVFAGIVSLGKIERRYWCRNLCPLGGMLSWMARPSLIKRYVDGECTGCTRCARDCPMGAIPTIDFTQTHRGECVLCMRCQDVCSQTSVRFGLQGKNDASGFAPDRRQVLAAVATGVGVGLLGAASTAAQPTPGHVIRPPGSIPEDDFLARCTRCLACVDACPTNGLQPLGLAAGWEALWSPVLVPTVGGCEEPCNNCTQMCPTNAIRHINHEEKSFAKIGTARVVRRRCVAWEELKPCLVCDEVCPYDAVEFLTVTDHIGTQRRPFVVEDKCVGCGLCENACPVHNPRAIVVERHGEERLADGSYITEKKRALRRVGDDRNIDYLREYRQVSPSNTVPPFNSPDDAEPLPPGFTID
jgi:polyferredoxin